VRAAEAVRDAFGCVVIIVHHCGLDETRPRGHTSLPGAVDAQIAVMREGDVVAVTVEMMRDGPEDTQVVSRAECIDVGEDSNGKTLTSLVMLPHDAAPAPRGGNRGWTKGLAVFRRAFVEALKDHGEVIHEEGDSLACLLGLQFNQLDQHVRHPSGRGVEGPSRLPKPPAARCVPLALRWRWIAAQDMTGTPGDPNNVVCGNTDYFLLSLVVAKKMNASSFEAALKTLVLDPLGQTRTRGSRSLTGDQAADEARYHMTVHNPESGWKLFQLECGASDRTQDRPLVPTRYGTFDIWLRRIIIGGNRFRAAVRDVRLPQLQSCAQRRHHRQHACGRGRRHR
jgi:hypothetical protein